MLIPSSTSYNITLQTSSHSFQVIALSIMLFICFSYVQLLYVTVWDSPLWCCPVVDVRFDPAGGAVLCWESSVCTNLPGLQLHVSLPSDSLWWLLGPQTCQGPPPAPSLWPWRCLLRSSLPVLHCDVDSSGIQEFLFFVCTHMGLSRSLLSSNRPLSFS